MRQYAVIWAYAIVRSSVFCHPARWCDCVYRWYQKSCFGSIVRVLPAGALMPVYVPCAGVA